MQTRHFSRVSLPGGWDRIESADMPERTISGALLLCGVCFFLSAVPASAVCPVPQIPANAEFFKRDIVFSGTVVSEGYDDRDVGGWFYRVRVLKVFRGPVRAEFTIYTENSSGRFPLEKGQAYLLFASGEQGRLEIDNCTNSAPLTQAAKSIEMIENILRSGLYGEIEGWVIGETGGIDVSGVRVTCRGASGTYSDVTDKGGRFHFRAPAGRYRVDFTSGEYYVNTDDIFWYKPGNFTLHPGETAALQLVSVRHLAR